MNTDPNTTQTDMNMDISAFDDKLNESLMKGQHSQQLVNDMYKTFTQPRGKKKNPRKSNYMPHSKDSVVNLDLSSN